MDFFERQEAAKRKTTVLTLYFLLALFFIICGVYLAIVVAWSLSVEKMANPWNPTFFLYVAAGVLTVILIGSLYKVIVLSKGGEKVAEMLGATPVDPNTKDPDERKLLNVVEEMGIASGIPVPRVYALQNEKGINALAAGLTPDSAVVAVTRGCMERLTRDELQGVVAHEFSHILNGDMRLNIRLMGIINGILVIAMIGRAILRGMSSKKSRSSGKKGGGGLPVLLLGLILVVVGYIGVFFGKLIKSGVSRQREFLADAAAVQFTRNPSGLTGALKKIAERKEGSRILDREAEEASHLFFANGLSKAFFRWLSTHPPIEERIRRIDPLFKVPFFREPTLEPGGEDLPTFMAPRQLTPDQIVSHVGNPQAEDLAFARKIMTDLHPLLSEAAHEPFGARALLYALLLDHDQEVRKKQIKTLESHADPAVMRHTLMLLPVVDVLGQGYRLPLADLAIPALKSLSPNQYEVFRENVRHLVEADKGISLFEYVIQRILVHHLDPFFGERRPSRVKYHLFDQVQIECRELLSILAWHGNRDASAAHGAFLKGMNELAADKTFSILPQEECHLRLLDSALERLSEASPLLKKNILKSSVQCISADRMIRVQEAELIRAVADSLDCPIPPLSPGGAITP
ncbi:MAG: M48 family metallopeptidase [Proteobacteria bacterium]|nr:M48 family metallopeptidase [Pseudomonadota bacterium]